MRGRFSVYTFRKQICSHRGARQQDVVSHELQHSRPVRTSQIGSHASFTLTNDGYSHF